MKIGVAFGDSVTTERIEKRRSFDDNPFGKPRMKTSILFALFVVGIGILLFRAFFLQVAKGEYFRNLSDGNRVKTQIVHAPRGIVFDRNNTPLVFNIPGFRKIDNKKTILLSRDKALSYIAKGDINLEVDSLRSYPYKDAFAHVLGYIGQISEDELSSNTFAGYRAGDLLGKSGIEKEYEKKLRGEDGKQLIEVDSMGKAVRVLGQTDPTPGTDITISLDEKLQNASYLAMKDVKKGAVVVSNPQGEVLALVSKPSFDPDLFTLGDLAKEYTATESSYSSISQILLDSENQPLLNRAIGGVYPPGSTFKLVTAAAGLERGVIDESFEVNDTGVLTVGSFSFANWYFTGYGRTEGEVNIVKAIKRSNDIFFYKLAEIIGEDNLSDTAKKFGLGKKLGIDLEGEESGTVPTTAWKKNVIGEQWYLGDTYHYGIGQGYLLTTPLQVNMWTSAIANGGVLYKPHLLKNSEFRVPASTQRGEQNSKLLSEKNFNLIREGMIESCSSGGVAWPLFEFKVKNEKLKVDDKDITEVPQSTVSAQFKDFRHITIACKTGTAQHGDESTLPHAWITLFAPAYNPQIIVTVLAESSGEGSNIAAPIAKKILEEWFSK